MNKKEFLDELEKRLYNIKKIERDEILSYYSEMIDDLIEDGKEEKNIIKDLGTLDDIVNKINENQESNNRIDRDNNIKNDDNKSINFTHIILLIISSPFLLIFLVIALSLVISVYSIIFSFYCMAIGLIFSGLVLIGDFVVNIFNNLAYAVLELGFAMFGIGFSIITILSMNWIIKKSNYILNIGFKKFIKFTKGGNDYE